jgi:hypothetical protein
LSIVIRRIDRVHRIVSCACPLESENVAALPSLLVE